MSEAKLDLIIDELGKIKDSVSNLNSRMDRSDARAESHEKMTQQLIHMVANNNTKLDILTDKTNALHAEVNEIKTNVRMGFDKTDRRFRSLEDDLQKTIHRVDLLEKAQ